MTVESKTKHKLMKKVGRAIHDFSMIEQGDKVMVCVSGGKDSYTMLDLLLDVQKRAPIDFEIFAVNLDQKQPDFPEHVLPDYLSSIGVNYRVVEEDTVLVDRLGRDEGHVEVVPVAQDAQDVFTHQKAGHRRRGPEEPELCSASP